MLIEVIPLGGSIDNRAITYFVSDEIAPKIQPGCIVEIPFHNALDSAVVTGMENREKNNGWLKENFTEVENLKSISRIITPLPLLSRYQIDTIFMLSSYLIVRPHQVLSLFLHKSMINYFEKKDFPDFRLLTDEKNKKESLQKIHFHHSRESENFWETISSYIKEKSVIVFPDNYSLYAYLKKHRADENVLVVPDSMTETKKHKAFRDIYNGEKNIIIWTRRILYYNLRAYDNIVYIEDSLNKTLMRFQHTYKHLEILRYMLPGYFHTTLVSSLPSIESMYLLHTGTYTRI